METHRNSVREPTNSASFNPWPYGIAGSLVLFLGCVIAAGIFATRQHIDLVRSDYYEADLRYQKRMDQLERTQALGKGVRVDLAAQANEVQVVLPLDPAGVAPTGSIDLYRPSDARLDQKVALAVDPQGRQTIPVSRLQPGLWKIRVQWTAAGHDYFHDSSVIIPAVAAARSRNPAPL